MEGSIYVNNQKKISLNNIVITIFMLGIIFKQFYLRKSGSLQIGDIFLVIPFFIIILSEKKVKINEIDINLWTFIFMSTCINLIYCLIYTSKSFILNNTYFVYIFIIVYTTRYLYNNNLFQKMLLKSSKIVLLVQLLIYLLGLGRYFSSTRYMGTFNDPNQFAYYITTMLFIIYLLSDILKNKVSVFWLCTSIFLIYKSDSSSMIIGVLIFIIFNLIYKSINSRIKYLAFFALLFVIIIFITSDNLRFNILNKLFSDRSINKMHGVKGPRDFIYKFLQDRALTEILINPSGFLYGTGAGYFERYGSALEMHSTFIGLFYYYGLVPYIFFLRWIYLNLKNSNKNILGIFIAVIFIAFTLANHRQPTFWMLFILGSNNNIK